MNAIIVVGLGYGDEGKGTIVDSLVRQHNSNLVVRYNGGFQAAHNVYTEDGRHHTFNQFGSGTLAGAATLLGGDVAINPLTMLGEEKRLATIGIHNALYNMSVSEHCLIVTPFHAALNKIRELSRLSPHGSTGTGIGEARGIEEHNFSNMTLRAGDIGYSCDHYLVTHKLEALRSHCALTCFELITENGLSGDEVNKAMDIFECSGSSLIAKILESYEAWANKIVILGIHQITDRINNAVGPVIFEGSQGVLLDKLHGFHPYTTWSDTTDAGARRMIEASLLPGQSEIHTIGVLRTYMTRHGRGPFVTESKDCQHLIFDDDNQYGRFQGDLRAGYFDLTAAKYAIQCCERVDSLAFTHCDKLRASSAYPICFEYDGADLAHYHCTTEASPEASSFTQSLFNVKPSFTYLDLNVNVIDFLSNKLNLPISILSYGKTHRYKKYMGMPQNDGLLDTPATQTNATPEVSTPVVETNVTSEASTPAVETNPEPIK